MTKVMARFVWFRYGLNKFLGQLDWLAGTGWRVENLEFKSGIFGWRYLVVATLYKDQDLTGKSS